MAKILIIRFSSIGDIVLASPVFRCLKKQLPDAEVQFLTKTKFKAVSLHNPFIDKFHYLNDDINITIKELKQEGFDYVIDLHKNFRSIKIKKALAVKTATIKKLSWQKFLLTNFNINVMPNRHITLRSLDALKILGVKDDGVGLDYFIGKQDEVAIQDIPASHHAGYIALVIGASYHTKKLPVQKLVDLCKSLPHPIILLGGKEDHAVGEAITVTDEIKIYNACGKFSLNESADLIRNSKLVISHDTGLLYIACAFGKRTLAIWGATSPKLQVEPFYGSSHSQEEAEKKYKNYSVKPWCQPCSKYGTKKCPLGHFKCMQQQKTDQIANDAMQWLNRN